MSDSKKYLEILQAAVLKNHKSKAAHKDTIFVQGKTGDNEIVWEGHVEVFSLMGHPGSTVCYAWQHTDTKGNIKIFTALRSHVVDSPARAVQAAIFIGTQPPVNKTGPDTELFKKRLQESEQLCSKAGIMSEDLSAPVNEAKGIKENLKQKGIFPK